MLVGLAGCRHSQNRSKPWEEFSGANALAHVQTLVEIGPRPPGTDALEKARVYITEQLEKNGWSVVRQPFPDETPRGKVSFVNLIARFRRAAPAKSKGTDFLIASHYDTKTFDNARFVGANDGGSSTGALIELARVLARYPAVAARIELVFFDGEEACENFTETDGLYGSRHYAKQLVQQNRVAAFRGAILWDMIGDRSLTITLPPDSPAQLARDIFASADALKLRNHFTYFDRDVIDDHTPLNKAGVPAIDLIDFDYPAWHTTEDTLDKISEESLQIVGSVTLYYLFEKAFK